MGGVRAGFVGGQAARVRGSASQSVLRPAHRLGREHCKLGMMQLSACTLVNKLLLASGVAVLSQEHQ